MAVLGGILLWFIGFVSFGYVGTRLWEWFVVPLTYIPIFRPIGFWHFMGLSLAVSLFFLASRLSQNKDKREDTDVALVGWAVGPWVAFAFGYFFQWMM